MEKMKEYTALLRIRVFYTGGAYTFNIESGAKKAPAQYVFRGDHDSFVRFLMGIKAKDNKTWPRSVRGERYADIAAEIENRTAEDEKLSDAITAETQRATEAETVLQTNIDNEVQRATEAEADLQTAIDAEKSERQAADEEIRTLIDSVTGNVDEVSKRLDAEIENRIQADNNLQKGIDDVNSRVDDLSATVDEVKADVEAKYTELNTKIDKETEERTEEVLLETINN